MKHCKNMQVFNRLFYELGSLRAVQFSIQLFATTAQEKIKIHMGKSTGPINRIGLLVNWIESRKTAAL